jgi:hypothetical protein
MKLLKDVLDELLFTKPLNFDPNLIAMSIEDSKPSSIYFSDALYKIPVILIPVNDAYIVDCDRKDIFINSCDAYVETDKGYHFLFAPNKKDKTLENLQDPKFRQYSMWHGKWAQFTKSKITGAKRIMKVNNPDWTLFCNRWNLLVEDYLK